MALLHLKLEDIQESNFQNLIDNGVIEKKTLDYKLILKNIFDQEKEKREFIADIISFANTDGGEIIYGIKEQEGIPVEIVGIEENMDNLKLRIENVLNTGIEPKIYGIDIHPVKLGNSKYVLIIRIPRSWNKPHRSKLDNRFTSRNSAGKYDLDIPTLKQMFLLGDTLKEKVRDLELKEY